MGLDLTCGTTIVHCGYSYIHLIRKLLTEITIYYLDQIKYDEKCQSKEDNTLMSPFEYDLSKETEYEEQEEDCLERKNKLCKQLQKTLSEPNILTPISYTSVRLVDNDLLREFGLIGWKHFVDHCDSDGFLTVGESIDILDWLSRILIYKDIILQKREEHLRDMDNQFINELKELFELSFQSKTYIDFR